MVAIIDSHPPPAEFVNQAIFDPTSSIKGEKKAVVKANVTTIAESQSYIWFNSSVTGYDAAD